jgi:hypothetical protein
MDFIGLIIKEEVSRFVNEASHKAEKLGPKFMGGHKKYTDSQRRDVRAIYMRLKHTHPNIPNKTLVRMAEKAFDKIEQERNQVITRKKIGGGTEKISKAEYDRKNVKSSAANAEQIRNRVDQENTDIAAVARKVFPKHTDEGAQSQLRKVLNGERPMTKRVASILSDMISSGQIAVKKD